MVKNLRISVSGFQQPSQPCRCGFAPGGFLHPRTTTPTDSVVKCYDHLAVIQEARYLGVTIDSSMSWNARTDCTIKKARREVGTL